MTSSSQSFDGQIRNFYNTRAPTYDSEPTSFHLPLAQDFATTALSLVEGPSPTTYIRCLDLACGTGMVTFSLFQEYHKRTQEVKRTRDPRRTWFPPGMTVHGIDISDVSLSVARAKLASSPEQIHADIGLMVRFWQHDITNLASLTTVWKNSYDIITCCSCIPLLGVPASAQFQPASQSTSSTSPAPKSLEQILAHWATYLKKPDGILIFDVPAPGSSPLQDLPNRAISSVRPDLRVVDRRWIKDEDSIKELILNVAKEGSGEAKLEVEKVFRTRVYRESDTDVKGEKVKEMWEKVVGNANGLYPVKEMREEEVERARRVFVEEVGRLGGDEGVVREKVEMLIGVARRVYL